MLNEPPPSPDSLRPPLGAAWIAWAFLLCLAGVGALVAAQRGPLDASLQTLALTAFWPRGAAVLLLAGLAVGAGQIGRTLRRDAQAPRWHVAALALAAVAALGGGALVLARGVASRWLLVGDDGLVATLVVGGLGTLLLAGTTSWLGGIDREIWPGIGDRADPASEPRDEEELATLGRLATLTLAGYLLLGVLLTLSVALLESAPLPHATP